MTRHLRRQPLARWGFTTLAVLALGAGQIIPSIVCGLIAGYAWHHR
jgi:hypothetical protein